MMRVPGQGRAPNPTRVLRCRRGWVAEAFESGRSVLTDAGDRGYAVLVVRRARWTRPAGEGVNRSHTDAKAGRSTVQLDSTVTTPQQIINAITGLDYNASVHS
jgi:hypothetical protein